MSRALTRTTFVHYAWMLASDSVYSPLLIGRAVEALAVGNSAVVFVVG